MTSPTWNPKLCYVWTIKQMRDWVDFNGACGLWNGKFYNIRYEKIVPGRYKVWFEEKNV